MTFVEFKSSLTHPQPPATIEPLLQAMWFDGKDDWEGSHNIAQNINTSEGSWVHAYLHRKEGDLGNASYWYSRAGKPMPSRSLAEEWEEIVRTLLGE
jgi:hypothetical protein